MRLSMLLYAEIFAFQQANYGFEVQMYVVGMFLKRVEIERICLLIHPKI